MYKLRSIQETLCIQKYFDQNHVSISTKIPRSTVILLIHSYYKVVKSYRNNCCVVHSVPSPSIYSFDQNSLFVQHNQSWLTHYNIRYTDKNVSGRYIGIFAKVLGACTNPRETDSIHVMCVTGQFTKKRKLHKIS